MSFYCFVSIVFFKISDTSCRAGRADIRSIRTSHYAAEKHCIKLVRLKHLRSCPHFLFKSMLLQINKILFEIFARSKKVCFVGKKLSQIRLLMNIDEIIIITTCVTIDVKCSRKSLIG